MSDSAGPSGEVRILAIMGSGETAPTMAKVHRALFATLGRTAAPAVLLDTPYGFQENADEITARALDYFADSVGHPLTLASFRRDDPDPVRHATAVTRARSAGYLFSGPGSPSYALAQWQGTEIPGIVADLLRDGGIVTFASAAALTLGRHTLPVYEIYKVGEPPHWLEGLDLLASVGLPVALIPHYDNAEGGTHDTRFCYLGERRLTLLEAQLPPDSFVLGVDSHTALVLDLAAGTAAVEGLGGVTIRAAGRSEVFPRGSRVAIGELIQAADRARGRASPQGTARATMSPGPTETRGPTPLEGDIRALEAAFAGDSVRAALDTEQLVHDWAADTDGTGDLAHAREVLRSMIVRLGEQAAGADADAAVARLRPLVELLVTLRARARADGDYAGADAIRDALASVGVELRDGPEATAWEVRGGG